MEHTTTTHVNKSTMIPLKDDILSGDTPLPLPLKDELLSGDATLPLQLKDELLSVDTNLPLPLLRSREGSVRFNESTFRKWIDENNIKKDLDEIDKLIITFYKTIGVIRSEWMIRNLYVTLAMGCKCDDLLRKYDLVLERLSCHGIVNFT